mmetsp:Transcript_95994/g.240614  ORF Transcript_95994/g.240614 Transcript_95994/m.240614 type:complete len:227 (+) Transcript_95994:290-970(+)
MVPGRGDREVVRDEHVRASWCPEHLRPAAAMLLAVADAASGLDRGRRHGAGAAPVGRVRRAVEGWHTPMGAATTAAAAAGGLDFSGCNRSTVVRPRAGGTGAAGRRCRRRSGAPGGLRAPGCASRQHVCPLEARLHVRPERGHELPVVHEIRLRSPGRQRVEDAVAHGRGEAEERHEALALVAGDEAVLILIQTPEGLARVPVLLVRFGANDLNQSLELAVLLPVL